MGEADAITACCSSFISLVISIPMICVGNAYWNWCKVGASAYLYHSGILGLVVAIVNTLFAIGVYICRMCSPDGKTKFALTLSIGIAEIVRMIWGFVIVFPAYEHVEYHGNYSALDGQIYNPYYVDLDTSPEYYCEYTPFMFAFVLLVIEAVLISLGAFCGCCVGCFMFCH